MPRPPPYEVASEKRSKVSKKLAAAPICRARGCCHAHTGITMAAGRCHGGMDGAAPMRSPLPIIWCLASPPHPAPGRSSPGCSNEPGCRQSRCPVPVALPPTPATPATLSAKGSEAAAAAAPESSGSPTQCTASLAPRKAAAMVLTSAPLSVLLAAGLTSSHGGCSLGQRGGHGVDISTALGPPGGSAAGGPAKTWRRPCAVSVLGSQGLLPPSCPGPQAPGTAQRLAAQPKHGVGLTPYPCSEAKPAQVAPFWRPSEKLWRPSQKLGRPSQNTASPGARRLDASGGSAASQLPQPPGPLWPAAQHATGGASLECCLTLLCGSHHPLPPHPAQLLT